jgi:heterodisulfide reductase subunit D
MRIDDIRLEIEICGFCPLMCKDICCFHGNAKTEDSAPHIRNLHLWRVMETAGEGEKKRVLKEAADIIYQCTLCGQCTAWCARSRDIPTNMMAGRADAVEQGVAPGKVAELSDRTEREHNPYGEPHAQRMSRLERKTRDALLRRSRGTIGLWLGCTTLYHQPEMAESLFRIMEASDTEYRILGEDEWCCGLPQYKLGLRKSAAELAAHNVQAMEKLGIRKLVVDCPECYRAFTEFYPAMGHPFHGEVVHSSGFILGLIEQGKLTLKREVKKLLTYHDPCELARHCTADVRTRSKTSDLFDPPRELLRRVPGVTLKEMRFTREKTFCCGGTLGVREMYPEVSFEIGKKVPREAAKTGAGTLAVACPACKRQFADVTAGEKGGIEVTSIVELVAQSL